MPTAAYFTLILDKQNINMPLLVQFQLDFKQINIFDENQYAIVMYNTILPCDK